MLALARRFGLALDDTYDGGGGTPRLFLQGRRRHRRQFGEDMAAFDRRITRLAGRIGAYDYRNPSRLARQVDEMTALEIVDRYMPGGSASIAARSYHCYLASYLGPDLRDLGGLAVVDDRASRLRGDDERYHIRGGNDQIVHGLAQSLSRDAVTMDAPLRSVERRRDGSFTIRFGGVGRPTHADAVVFCRPFTALRDADLDGAGLSRRKLRCIAELGVGTNAKLIMHFAERPQNYGNWNGYLDVDRPFVETWESSAGQPGSTGLITAYFGGRSGAWLPGHVVHGAAPHATVDSVLDALSRRGHT
jgi:monoamine oxidase